MEIMDRALLLERRGNDVIHLEKGELDFDTPAVIRDSAIEALAGGKTKYTNSTGLLELRDAICERYHRCHGVDLDPSQVIVNSGSSPALLALFLAAFDRGDEIVIADPCYPVYPHYAEAVGARPVSVDTAEHGFRYTAESARASLSPRTRAVMINFPSNPLGSTIDAVDLAAFTELGPLIISDEVYQGLQFDGHAERSILEFTDEAVVVGSFSKEFAMTGWRLGYLIVPRRLIASVKEVQQRFFISANSFVQWAGVTALQHRDEILARWRRELTVRRDCLVDGLARLGLRPAAEPQGAFYVFTPIPAGLSSAGFAARLLDRTQVAVTPGSAFGPAGEGYVRFSYGCPRDRIRQALERIEPFLTCAGDASLR